jgi:hypothetical protein
MLVVSLIPLLAAAAIFVATCTLRTRTSDAPASTVSRGT